MSKETGLSIYAYPVLMVELKRASHCVYKIRYHMVLCIKYRRQLLFAEDKINYIKHICSELGERYWFDFDAIGSDGDHVHVFVGAAPQYSPSRVKSFIPRCLSPRLPYNFPFQVLSLYDLIPKSLPMKNRSSATPSKKPIKAL